MSSEEIYKFMKEHFSNKNDFLNNEFESNIVELKKYGIHTFEEFKKLIIDNKDAIIEYDKNFLKDKIEVYKAMEGEEFVKERLENEYFFSYQALIVVALKIQFPVKFSHEEFLRNR